jgi:hypothetical protein
MIKNLTYKNYLWPGCSKILLIKITYTGFMSMSYVWAAAQRSGTDNVKSTVSLLLSQRFAAFQVTPWILHDVKAPRIPEMIPWLYSFILNNKASRLRHIKRRVCCWTIENIRKASTLKQIPTEWKEGRCSQGEISSWPTYTHYVITVN